MPETFDDLTVPALNALASAPAGTMTFADFESHLETRFGSTEQAASDAQSPESRAFRDTVERLVTTLVDRGFVSTAGGTGPVTIAPDGRAFIGR